MEECDFKSTPDIFNGLNALPLFFEKINYKANVYLRLELKMKNILMFLSTLFVCVNVCAQQTNDSEPEDIMAWLKEVPPEEDIYTLVQRETVEENEELIARTIRFMLTETNLEDYESMMGELLPEQSELLKKEFAEYERKLDSINERTKEIVSDWEIRSGREATPKIAQTLIESERQKIKLEFFANTSQELLLHQQVAIANWKPEIIGIKRTLTDTPIGDAIGLTKRQKKKLREESERIGIEFYEMYKKCRTEVYELHKEVLTKEQARKVNELYYPSHRGDYRFAELFANQLLQMVPRGTYPSDDLRLK